MKDVIIREVSQRNNVKIAIFTYTGNKDPKVYLDEAVSRYTSGKEYNEFIDSHLDNPWTRVIVIGINEMTQHKYEPELQH